MKLKIRFGPAGGGDNYKGKSVGLPAYLAERGLSAYEVQCGHGVNIRKESAEALREQAENHGIALSLHAPYYISLTNPERREGNIGYIRSSVEAAAWMGAQRVVVHTGAVMKMTREEALSHAMDTLRETLDTARTEGWGSSVSLCPETMGKNGQLGTLTEVLELCKLDESIIPCIDFGHLYARSGGLIDGEAAFETILDEMENALGLSRAQNCHIHFSRIEYTAGGEKRHRTFEDNGGYGPDWLPLCRLLCCRGYYPTVICESRGTQVEDAQVMMETAKQYEGEG